MAEQNMHIPWEGWKCVKLIGKGGYGTVYEIQRVQHGITEKAAMKKISVPQSADEVDNLRIEGYDDESITQRFSGIADEIIREYGMMIQMKGNANIVYCDDYKIIQQADGFGQDIYIKMELLTPLVKALDQVATEAQIIRFGMDMCSGLEVCQRRKVIHRDIKPQNIFVSEDGVFKLGDFGIARTAEKTTRATAGIGTYQFMAPEVMNNQPYGSTVDIYSLGLVMYWLLNGRRSPFLPLPPAVPKHGEEEQALRRRFAGWKIPAPTDGSEGLKRIVLKACAFDPKDRYQSAKEMREDLQRLSETAVPAPVVKPMQNSLADQETELPEEATVGPVFACDVSTAVGEDKTAGDQFTRKQVKKKAWPLLAALGLSLPFLCIALLSKSSVVSPEETTLPVIQVIETTIPTTVPEDTSATIPTTIPEETTASIPKYTLMEDEAVGAYYDEWALNPVFGSKYRRNQIRSITFLSSTEDANESSWDVSWSQNGTVLAWVKPNSHQYDLFIGAEGGVSAPENCKKMFAGYENLLWIDFNGAFDTSNVTNMRALFEKCESLRDVDVSTFNTSKVTNMRAMFCNCRSLTTLDVSGFDTSNVEDMDGMFYYCSGLKNLDVSGFDTSNVIIMKKMFYNCWNLTDIDVSNFDVSKVNDYEKFMNSGRTINGRPWEEFFRK